MNAILQSMKSSTLFIHDVYLYRRNLKGGSKSFGKSQTTLIFLSIERNIQLLTLQQQQCKQLYEIKESDVGIEYQMQVLF